MNSNSSHCFIKDPDTVFKLVKIVDRLPDGNLLVVDNLADRGEGKQLRVKEQDTIPVHSIEELENPPTDLIKLHHVHQATILHTLRSRFSKDQIYTSIGPILVALNPFKWIPEIYDDFVINKYKNRQWNLSDNPHVYAIAHDSFSDLQYGENQSMIISGESGAGKTEATKQALNYLAHIAGSSSGIQEKILKASPILESWGNAKTLRNNNSSRFGKYIEVWFDGNSIIGSSNTTYILEKSRVVKQAQDERNYHVFYQLLAGGDVTELQSYQLHDENTGQAMSPERYFYINQSGCVRIDDVDDAADFREAVAAFHDVGFTSTEVHDLYRVIAGVLHLGNVLFESSGDESMISHSSESSFQTCAQVFHVDAEMFRKSLLFKKVRSGGGKRSSVAFSPYSPEAAIDTRDAFAKEIYRRCFDWIVSKINMLMYDDRVRPTNMIGVLDIFGFEIFKQNSFEQLCINLANEALQQHFNYHIFQAEINIYQSEDVPVPQLDYKDNQDVLDLITKRPKGLIPVLDEECMVPKGSWEGFVSKFAKHHIGNPRFKQVRTRPHDLGIVHYAGEVFYDPSLFLVKNKDTLAQDLVEVFSASRNSFIVSLFDEILILEREESIGSFRKGMMTEDDVDETPRGRGGMMKRQSTFTEAKQTVGKKFSLQLEALMKNLNATKPRYIRCVKPNQVKKPNIFVHHLANEQLTYSGVFEAVIIMQNGYPFRLSHNEFRDNYHLLVQSPVWKPIIHDCELFNAFEKSDNRQILWADELSFAKFAAPFELVRKEKGKLYSRGNMSRRQCELMVSLICRSLPELDRNSLFVGNSKIFYRAPEHRLLDNARGEIQHYAILCLQACARRYIAHKIVRHFLSDVKSLIKAMQTRDLPALTTTSSTLASLNERLNKIIPGVQCSEEIVRIGQQYSRAMQEEKDCLSSFHRVFNDFCPSKNEISLMHEESALLVSLLPIAEKSKDIHFQSAYRTIKVQVLWSDNEELKEFVNQTYMLQRKVDVTNMLNTALKDENEVSLAHSVEILKELKSKGEIADEYMTDSEEKARKLIQQAEELSQEVLSSFQTILITGQCQLIESSTMVGVKECKVESAPIQDLVNKTKATFGTKKLPYRVVVALQAAEKLSSLRQLAEQSRWQELWNELGASKAIPLSGTTSSSSFSQKSGEGASLKHDNDRCFQIQTDDADPLKHSALPKSILEQLDNEIRTMVLTAVTFFLLPRFEAILEGPSPIPEVACMEPVPIDTSELQSQLQFAKQYQHFFDKSLTIFVARMEQHLALRQAIALGNREQIIELLKSSTMSLIPASHVDIVNAKRYLVMYDALQQIAQVLEMDKWKGSSAQFEPSQVKTSSLEAWCSKCEHLHVDGDGWHSLMYICEVVLGWKKELVGTSRFECAPMFDALVEITDVDSEWYQSVLQLLTFTQFPELHLGIRILLADLETLKSELNHFVGMNNIIHAFEKDKITENISMPLQTRPLSLVSLAITENRHRLLMRIPLVESNISRLQLLQEMRELAMIGDFDRLGKIIESLPPEFDQVSPDALYASQFLAVRARWFDYFVRKTIAEKIHIREVPAPLSHDCELYSLIKKVMSSATSSMDLPLTPKAKSDLLLAKAFFLLRCALRDERWEPVSIVFFGFTPTAKLGNVLIKGEGNFPAEVKSLDRIISSIRSLDSSLSLEQLDQKVHTIDIENISVSEVLVWLNHISELSEESLEEIKEIQRLAIDRHVRAVLLVAASTGKFGGNLDKVNHRTVRLEDLRTALTFCRLKSEYISKETILWFQACELLLKLREVIINVYSDVKALNSDPTWKDTLHESVHVEEIRDLIDSLSGDFPVEELQLILDKIVDLKAFEELEQALKFGAPSFVNGKFDISRLQYDHLIERLDVAKKVNMQRRSDRLDRFFFYLELIINLRTALSANQWDLSDRGDTGKKTALDRYMVTVKRCLSEYGQAQKFFRTPIPGVPPPLVVEEFALVEREWDRRLTIQRFHHAFKTGAISGAPFSLVVHDARTDLLETEIDRAASMESTSGEVDRDIQIYVHAAHELVAIRKTALEIQAQYRSHCQFGKATNSIRIILNDQAFLPDCISKAVYRIDEIRKSKVENRKYPIAAIDPLIQEMKYCTKLPIELPEVTLLQMDFSERCFTNEVLTYIAAMDNTVDVDAQMKQALTNLQHTFTQYYQRSEKMANMFVANKNAGSSGLSRSMSMKTKSTASLLSLITSSSSSGGLDSSNKLWVSQYLHDSALFLVHYLRAKINEYYDQPDRDWKRDINLENTPRIPALQKNLKLGKYTMQQIIRSAMKFDIHHKVANVLRTAEAEIEDRISQQELETALNEAKGVTGTGIIGHVQIPEIALSYAESVLSRIETVVGSRTGNIKQLKVLLECIYTMRQRLVEHKYNEVLAAAAKFIRVGNKDLQFMVGILYDSADGLSVGIARKEFFLLAKEACDRLWQTQMLDIILKGRINGSRGAVASFSILFEEIQPLLQVSEMMTEKSETTQTWTKLAESIYLLRFKFLELFQPPEISSSKEETIVFLPHMNMDQSIARYLEDSVNVGVTNILELGRVNWQSEIDVNKAEELLEYIVDIKDQLRTSGLATLLQSHSVGTLPASNSNSLSVQFVTSVERELNLIDEHLHFILGVQQLHHALLVSYFSLEKDGLLLQSSSADLSEAVRRLSQQHLFPDRVQEKFIALLLSWSQEFMLVMEKMSNILQRRINLIIEPGSSEFTMFRETILHFLRFNSNTMLQINSNYENRGVRKFLFPTDPIRATVAALSDAVRDHSTILMLNSIIFADKILWYENEENHQLVVTIKRMHAIPFVLSHSHSQSLESHSPAIVNAGMYSEEVDFLTTSIREEFDAPKTLTSQELVQYTISLLQFRHSVIQRKWLQAHDIIRHLAATTHVHTNTKDFEVFQQYLVIMKAKRQLEYEILVSLTLPDFQFWSMLREAGTALSIMGRSLDRFLRGVVDGSVEPLPSFKIFGELAEVAHQVLEVTKALKAGLWISAMDLAEHPKHRLFLDAVVKIGDPVVCEWHKSRQNHDHNHHTSSIATDEDSSVFSALIDLQQRLQQCKSIGAYLRNFLAKKIQQLHSEFLVVQLEHMISATFAKIHVSGNPGELIIEDNLTGLHQLLLLLDKYFDVWNGDGKSEISSKANNKMCHKIRQGYLTAKALYGAFSAHKRGDVERLIDYVNILLYCNQKGVLPGFLERKNNVRVKALTQSFTTASDEEFESVFSEQLNLFLERSSTTTLETNGHVQDLPDSDSEEYKAQRHVEDKFSQEEVEETDEMNKEIKDSIVTLVGISWKYAKDIPALRPEVVSLVPLLEQHCLFESLYSDYEKALLDTPASGHPGEIESLAPVKYQSLEKLMPLFSVFPQLREKLAATSFVTLLYTSVSAVHLLRQSQVFGDMQGVMEAVNIWKDGLANENDYDSTSSLTNRNNEGTDSLLQSSLKISLFGNRAKQFCALATSEMQFAEEDMQQRYLINALQEALTHEPGSIVDDIHSDQAHIEIENLVEACNLAMKLGIKCPTATKLYEATKHLYTLRRKMIEKDYVAVLTLIWGKTFTQSLTESNAESPTDIELISEGGLYDVQRGIWNIAANVQEFEIAWKLAATAYISQLIEQMYLTGFKSSQNNLDNQEFDYDNENSIEDMRISCQKVLSVTKQIILQSHRRHWLTSDLQRHLRSCAVLLELRSLFHSGEHELLLEKIIVLLHGKPRPRKSLFAQVIDNASLEELGKHSTGSSTDDTSVVEESAKEQEGIIDDQTIQSEKEVVANEDDHMDRELWTVYEVSDLSVQCQNEINHIKSRAAYAVIVHLLQEALSINYALQGHVGQMLDGQHISSDVIVRMFVRTWRIGFQHRDVQLLQQSAGIIYRIRKAQEGNRWLRDPVSNFQSTDFKNCPFKSLLLEKFVDTSSYGTRNVDKPSEEDMQIFVDNCLGKNSVQVISDQECIEDIFEENEDIEDVMARLSLEPRLTTAEILLTLRELRYRQMVIRLLHAIYNGGFNGTPGDIQEENEEKPHHDELNNENDADEKTDEKKINDTSETNSDELKPKYIDLQSLEKAIEFSMRHLEMSRNSEQQMNECVTLIRDAKLLLEVRKYRLHDDFVELNDAILRAEEHNMKVLDMRNNNINNSNHKRNNPVDLMLMEPILPKVWEEIKLLKYDALFQLALAEFSAEMTRDNQQDLDSDNDQFSQAKDYFGSSLMDEDAVLLTHGERIANLRNIYEFVSEAAQGFPCPDFERLLEAISMAIQLREFVRDHQGRKSPQGIIDQVAKVKLRDRKKGVTCYMTLLIFELSKLSNVLEFPILLEQLHKEILLGKAYLAKPIGMIDYGAIKVDTMAEAYNLAKPSMEIMGTDENLAFMNLAKAILELRVCLRQGDLTAAMNVVIDNETHLQVRYFSQNRVNSGQTTCNNIAITNASVAESIALAALAEDEVSRLRVEMENYDAGRLIAHGLKTGRCLNVIAIAKMRSYFCENLSAVFADEEMNHFSSQQQQNSNTIPVRKMSITNNKTTKTRRVSAGIQQMLSMFQERYLADTENSTGDIPGDVHIDIDDDGHDAQTGASTPGSDKVAAHRRISQTHNQTSSRHASSSAYSLAASLLEDQLDLRKQDDHSMAIDPEVRESIKASIYGLKRAVTVARRVSQMSEQTRFYFKAAETILRLREGILHDRWTEVIDTVQQDIALPTIALEEVNAIREGLFLQKAIEMIADALLKGTVDGSADAFFAVKLELIEWDHLEEIVDALEAGMFQDSTAQHIIELAKLVIVVRKSFVRWVTAMRQRSKTLQLMHTQSNYQSMNNQTTHATQLISNSFNYKINTHPDLGDSLITQNQDSLVNVQEASLLAVHDAQLEQALNRIDDFLQTHVKEMLRNFMVLNTDSTPGRNNKDASEIIPSPFYWINNLVDAIYSVKSEIITMKEAVDYAKALHHLQAVVNVCPVPVSYYVYHREQEQVYLTQREQIKLQQREQQMKLTAEQNRRFSFFASLSPKKQSTQLLQIEETPGDNDDILVTTETNTTLTSNIEAEELPMPLMLSLPTLYNASRTQDFVWLPRLFPEQLSEFTLYDYIVQGDRYFVKLLQETIAATEGYIAACENHTSEELLANLSFAKELLSLRQLLATLQVTYDDGYVPPRDVQRPEMFVLLETLRRLQHMRHVSPGLGHTEVALYADLWHKADTLEHRLLHAFQEFSLTKYPLDVLLQEWIHDDDMDAQLLPLIEEIKAESEIIQGLVLTLPRLIKEMEDILKIRKYILLQNRFHVEKLLLRYETSLGVSQFQVIRREFRYMRQWLAFQDFDRRLRLSITAFPRHVTVDADLSTLIPQLYAEFAALFTLFDAIEHDKDHPEEDNDSENLDDRSVDNDDLSETERQLQSYSLFSPQYFAPSSYFSAADALFALLGAVSAQRWLSPSLQMRTHRALLGKEVACRDALFLEFFHVSSGTIISVESETASMQKSGTIKTSSSSETVEGKREASGQSQDDDDASTFASLTVFGILQTTNWSHFPEDIQRFFHHCRARLIEKHILEDIQYYTYKGCAVFDNVGNLSLSTLYLRMLQSALHEVARVNKIVHYRGLGATMTWSPTMQWWLHRATMVHHIRSHIVYGAPPVSPSSSTLQNTEESDIQSLLPALSQMLRESVPPASTTRHKRHHIPCSAASLAEVLTSYGLLSKYEMHVPVAYQQDEVLWQEILVFRSYLATLQAEEALEDVLRFISQHHSEWTRQTILRVKLQPAFQKLIQLQQTAKCQLPTQCSLGHRRVLHIGELLLTLVSSAVSSGAFETITRVCDQLRVLCPLPVPLTTQSLQQEKKCLQMLRDVLPALQTSLLILANQMWPTFGQESITEMALRRVVGVANALYDSSSNNAAAAQSTKLINASSNLGETLFRDTHELLKQHQQLVSARQQQATAAVQPNKPMMDNMDKKDDKRQVCDEKTFQQCTDNIITRLCEVLYFLPEYKLEEVIVYDSSGGESSSVMHDSARVSILFAGNDATEVLPFASFTKLVLFYVREMSEVYKCVRPHWTLVMLLTVYFLREELRYRLVTLQLAVQHQQQQQQYISYETLSALYDDLDTSHFTLHIPHALLALYRELLLGKYIARSTLNRDVPSVSSPAEKKTRALSPKKSFLGNNNKTQQLPVSNMKAVVNAVTVDSVLAGFYPADAPSIAVLGKYLQLLRRQQQEASHQENIRLMLLLWERNNHLNNDLNKTRAHASPHQGNPQEESFQAMLNMYAQSHLPDFDLQSLPSMSSANNKHNQTNNRALFTSQTMSEEVKQPTNQQAKPAKKTRVPDMSSSKEEEDDDALMMAFLTIDTPSLPWLVEQLSRLQDITQQHSRHAKDTKNDQPGVTLPTGVALRSLSLYSSMKRLLTLPSSVSGTESSSQSGSKRGIDSALLSPLPMPEGFDYKQYLSSYRDQQRQAAEDDLVDSDFHRGKEDAMEPKDMHTRIMGLPGQENPLVGHLSVENTSTSDTGNGHFYNGHVDTARKPVLRAKTSVRRTASLNAAMFGDEESGNAILW